MIVEQQCWLDMSSGAAIKDPSKSKKSGTVKPGAVSKSSGQGGSG